MMACNLLTVVLLLFIGLQGLNSSTTSSCDNSCDTDTSCDVGFHCCNSQCVPLPGIGENCPCSRCNSDSLVCQQDVCVFNGINCTCNDASDCSSDGRPTTCINNLCGIIKSGGTPPITSSVGQSCVYNFTCYDTRYCNSSKMCDFGPPGADCSQSQYCAMNYVCAGSKCRPPRAVSESCEANEQCPPSYTCRALDASSQQYCTTKGQVGDYCTEIFDCVNANCTNNACYLPREGEPCLYNSYCDSGFVCRFGTCASNATLPDGSACQNSRDCTSGICSQRLCWPMSYTSGSCNVSEQCPDGRCVDGKCFSIAFYNEKCNATQVCYDENRPCVNGTCPRLYSAYGEYCTVNEHCLFGSCISNACGFPSTCNVSTDCGLNSICDCEKCKPNRFAIYNSNYYQYMYYHLQRQMTEYICFASESPSCFTTIAKYNCLLLCGQIGTWVFPNGLINFGVRPSGYRFDCATLTYTQESTVVQPCCNAYNQTSCANNSYYVGCDEFHRMNFEPLLRVPEAPASAPQVSTAPSVAPPTAPNTTPSVTPMTATPSASPSTVPATPPVVVPAPTATPSAVPSTISTPTGNPLPTTQPSSSAPVVACSCAASTPICDTTINACVGQRVTPIVQCVQYSNNQYVAFMSYNNRQPSAVTLDDKINFLNLGVSNKPRDFAVGRPFVFPQSAFNVTSTTAQQVSWYLDGFELKFDLDDETIACPQDVTFVMTSSATVDQLVAIADDIVGNLSSIMSIPKSRLNVTFSSTSSKRQTSSSLITVVVLSSSSSSEPTPFTAALQFISSDSNEFMTRVPAARVSQVTAAPLPNEQTGSETVTPPTSDSSPVRSSPPPPSQSPRTVVSRAHNTIVHVSLIMCIVSVLLS